MKAWLRRRREIRRLRREEDHARDRFFRAQYAYQDIAVVLGSEPGAWADHGPVGQAQAEVQESIDDLKRAQRDLRRAEQVGHIA
ncbi:hypothetical protein [Paractinoplanes maris]|uniref:hypothetical protein n=1 Tax=Paractinoplanes maris TaxID=1734446 RepID=UPI0020223095|nr:hypothetical protein [Actinoplanes maris]